jgi:hypothetical protein
MPWDSSNLRIKGAKDRAALAEQEALERVSRVEVDNFTVLYSAHANAEDLTQKVSLLEDKLVEEHWAREASEMEHREHSEELTLL